MAGDSNSKRRVSRSTESKNTQDININIIEGNNNPKAQVQERAAVFDQHFYYYSVFAASTIFTAKHPRLKQGKIGRASWRERV